VHIHFVYLTVSVYKASQRRIVLFSLLLLLVRIFDLYLVQILSSSRIIFFLVDCLVLLEVYEIVPVYQSWLHWTILQDFIRVLQSIYLLQLILLKQKSIFLFIHIDYFL
jgi:hypothetical protein